VSEPHVFEVGEIAILKYSRIKPEYDGEDVEVIGPLLERKSQVSPGEYAIMQGYMVRVINGDILNVEPQQLKKKPPYDQRLGTTWAQCAWNPRSRVITMDHVHASIEKSKV
jgi:hypothetical protein